MQCSIPECPSEVHGRGLCRPHYMRLWRYGDPLGQPQGPGRGRRGTYKPIEERFWSRVNREGPISEHCSTPCWLWTGAKRHAYGEIWYEGKRIYVHRLSYIINVGPLDEAAKVLHRCDTPLCVRPDHLFTGTQRDNVLDMMSKGRGRGQFGHADPL